jgi:hypothetical protein
MCIRVLLVGAAALMLASVPAGAETLEDALAAAFTTNPTIRAERARLRATRELKAQAWAEALPQIGADGSYARTTNTQTLNPGVFGGGGTRTSTFNPLTGQVQGSLTVFDGFRNVNAIRQARARVRAGGAELASVEQRVLQDVATAYFDVLRDQTIYESNLNNVEVLVRQKREAQLRFDVGEITRTDVAQADARLAQARASLAAAQANLAVARARYGELADHRARLCARQHRRPRTGEGERARRRARQGRAVADRVADRFLSVCGGTEHLRRFRRDLQLRRQGVGADLRRRRQPVAHSRGARAPRERRARRRRGGTRGRGLGDVRFRAAHRRAHRHRIGAGAAFRQ